MKIARAGLADIDQAASLFNSYRLFYHQTPDIEGARQFISDRLTRDESVIFLATDDYNQPIGFIQLYLSFSSVSMRKIWILNDLFVAESARRKGVAQSLLQEAKKLAKETGAKGLILETGPDNEKAQELYHKTGFEKDENYHYSFFFTEE